MLNSLPFQLKKAVTIVLIMVTGVFISCGSDNGSDVPPPPSNTITSGRINTQNKFSFTHGRMDVYAKFPKTANGLWPAIWLLGENISTVDWPACGEIDVIEMGNKTGMDNNTSERFLTSGCHWGEIQPEGGHPAYARNDNAPVSLQDGFHLYTMTWDETKLRIYIDPQLDTDNSIVNADNSFFYEILINVYNGDYPVGEYFHKPFFIVLNLAVGGDYTGIYNVDGITALNEANNYEAKMYVDYVKVYDDVKGNTVKWQDLFDGDKLDESKWNIEVNSSGGGNNELQIYSKNNVSIGKEPGTGKSCLVITAKR